MFDAETDDVPSDETVWGEIREVVAGRKYKTLAAERELEGVLDDLKSCCVRGLHVIKSYEDYSHIERYADILPFEEDFLTWVATQEQEQDPESIRIYWNVKTLYDLLEPVERSIMYLSRTLTRLKQIGRLAIPMKQARMSPEEDNLIMAGTLKKQFEMGTEVFETYDHAESLRIINMQNGILNERLRDADQAVLSQFRTSDSTGQGIMILEIWRNITRQDAPRTFEAQYQVAEAKKLITLMHLDVTERLLGHFPRALASTLKLKKMFEAV